MSPPEIQQRRVEKSEPGGISDAAGALSRCLDTGCRLVRRVADALHAIGAGWVCVIMTVICADVLSRGIANRPLPGVAEFVSLSIVALLFLQLTHTLAVGRLTRVEVFVNLLRGFPRLSALLAVATNLLGAVTFAAIIVGSYPAFVRSWTSDEFVGVLGAITIPTWPSKAALLGGAVLVSVQFVLFALVEIRRLFNGRPQGRR